MSRGQWSAFGLTPHPPYQPSLIMVKFPSIGTDTQHLTYALSPSSTLLNNGQLLAYPLPPLVSTGQHLPHPHHPLSAFDLFPRQQWSAIATPPPVTDEICERRLKNTHLERS